MAGGVERQIFEDAGRDEVQTDPFPAPDAADDQAVSEAIRALQRTPDAPPPPRPVAPPAPRQPSPQQPEDLDENSASGLRQALVAERKQRQDLASQIERYQQAERERAARDNRPPISERLFTDPEKTLEELRQEWTQPLQQTIATLHLNQEFSSAEARYGPEKFQAAFQAWYAACENGQDALSYFSVMNAPSPGDAVMRWYRMRELLEKVGDGDLEAYNQRVIEEAMQGRAPPPVRDPETGRFTQRPQAPQPRLPTATSRLGASNRHRDEDDENDGSEAAIFAAARPSRRGER